MSQDDLIPYTATEILCIPTLSPEAECVVQSLQAVVDSIYARAQAQIIMAHGDRERASIARDAQEAAEPYYREMTRLYSISANPGIVIKKV